MAMVLIYRFELGTAIYSKATQIAELQPAAIPLGKFLEAAFNDFTFVCLLGGCYLGLKMLARRWFPRLTTNFVLKTGEGIFVTGLLLLLAFTERAHFQLLIQLDTGLTLGLVKTTPTMVGAGDIFRMMTRQDVAFLVVPILVLILAGVFARAWQRIDKYLFLLLLGFVLCAQTAGLQTLPSVIAANPVAYFLSDAIQEQARVLFGKNGYYASLKDLPGAAQTNSIQFVDEAFVYPRPQLPAPRRGPVSTADGKSWNILFFVLETCGADYVFDTSSGNPTPMPFLQKMTGQGLYFSNHHASADNSAQAAFSLLTGLYPSTGSKNFSEAKNNSIPTLNHYLPAEYDYFLMHPTDPGFSFPQYLLLNNGLRDFYNVNTMPPGRRPAPNNEALNEIDSFDFLITRLDSAREPFLGVYWSFIPHFPFSDYGPEYRILPGDTRRQAYYNNLRTLDAQLQRVFEHLKKTGMADRTLMIIVGDHGEAFGQQPQVWGHTFGFNAEMFRVPMLIWQPKLISPEVIKYPTSHVDVTPTLLDILGFPYDESRFQGESVLRGTPRRKYIFTLDIHADYIAAISPQMDKAVIGFHENYFAAFNLARDPGEKFPLDGKSFLPQAEAIIKFRNYQSRMIDDYNQAILAGRPFPPKDHSPSGEK